MTREEFEMRTLVRESDVIDRTDGSELAKAFNYLWEKYVEQEPCDDAISRQAVLDLAKKGVLVSNGNYESVCKAINDLPSVNLQEPKTGHWYYDEERGATGVYAICSNCDEEIYQTGGFKYCPNCGARMNGKEN